MKNPCLTATKTHCMARIFLLVNEVLEYPWGSDTFIPDLLGMAVPSGRPMAEIWMGAHSKAPSKVIVDNNMIPLNRLIKEHPEDILGKSTLKKFGQMPFLFKVLSASKPLSIQAHPDKHQAGAGFVRENSNSIPMDAAHRNYRDNNHKPELICALTEMWALKGFRKPGDIIRLLKPLEDCGKRCMEILEGRPDKSGIRAFFMYLMGLERPAAVDLVNSAVNAVRTLRDKDPAYEWMIRLSNEYPGDIGLFAPLYLNVVKINPGESMFLPARMLHAYLSGSGLEIMANSDNVLRGGLTGKHIDKKELSKILSFSPDKPQIINGIKKSGFETFYITDSEEFMLSVINLPKDTSAYNRKGERSIEIILCTQGRATVTSFHNQDPIEIKKGDSMLIPAAVRGYTIEGKATIYKAAVP